MKNLQNPTLAVKFNFKILATGESINLSPMSSREEKSILEIQAIQEDEYVAFDEICKMLSIPDRFSEELKLACLLRIREISSGSDCIVKYKCPKCNHYSESLIYLNDMLDFSLWDKVDKFRDVKLKDDANLQLLSDCHILQSLNYVNDCEEFDGFNRIDEIKDLAISLKARIPKFQNEKTCKCLFCGFESLVNIDRNFVLQSMSNHSISSMYQAYNKLVINGFTKQDVDSMLPFEREVHLGLIDKYIEDQKNRNNGKSQN